MSQNPILKAGSASDVTNRNKGRVEYGNILGQQMAVEAGILPSVTLQKGGGGSAASRVTSILGASVVTAAERTTAVTNLVSNISINAATAVRLSAAARGKFGITNVPGTVTATIPGAPTGLVATPNNQSLSIAFSINNGGGAITNYSYSTNGTTYTAFSPAQTSSPVTITGLTNGTSYTVYLKATNAIGTGPASASVTATPALTVPDAPTIGTPTIGNGSVSLTFTAPASNGGSSVTNYSYSTDGTNYSAFSPAQTTSPLTISGLSNGVTYTIRIKAINAIGSSLASSSVSATPAIVATVIVSSGMVNIYGITIDLAGNIYASDSGANKIWKITQEGVLSLFAGTGTSGYNDGAAATAQFRDIRGIITGKYGGDAETLYICEITDQRVRRIYLASGNIQNGAISVTAGTVSTFNAAQTASFISGSRYTTGWAYIASTNGTILNASRTQFEGSYFPFTNTVNGISGSALDNTGAAFTCHTSNNIIYKNTSSFVTTVPSPIKIVIDLDTNDMYVSSTANSNIYKITSAGIVSTYFTTSAPSAALTWYNGRLYIGVGTTISKL